MKNHGDAARIVELVGQRSANIFTARGYCCSESVIVVINQAFRGDLSFELAVRLGSGFCHGMGGAGCTCGALAGAEVAISLFLGPRQAGGMKAKEFEKVAKEMHDRFRTRFAATCCRVLTRRRKEKNGVACRELTVGGAEIAAGLILEQRPELAVKADLDFLGVRESKLGVLGRKLLGRE